MSKRPIITFSEGTKSKWLLGVRLDDGAACWDAEPLRAPAGFYGSLIRDLGIAQQAQSGYSAQSAHGSYPTLFNNGRFNVMETRHRSHAIA